LNKLKAISHFNPNLHQKLEYKILLKNLYNTNLMKILLRYFSSF